MTKDKQENIQNTEPTNLKETRRPGEGPDRPPNQDPQTTGDDRFFKGPNIFNILMVIFVITFIINTLFLNNLEDAQQTIAYSQFLQLVDSGNLAEVHLSDEEIVMTIAEDANLVSRWSTRRIGNPRCRQRFEYKTTGAKQG